MPTAPEPTYIAHASSGIQGLQGAADLLKGFASSMPVTNLSGTTWPAPIQMTAPAPGVHHQYIYNAVSAQNTHQQQQTQVVYTQGPNGQPQMQQIIYAPAQTQASVTLGSDGQYYLTTTPTYTLPNPTTTHPGEQLQQQQYTSAPGASMISYAPQDNSAYSSAPTIQFVWPQQLQQQQQSWIQQAQQIQQISQPGSSSQLDQGTQQQQQQKSQQQQEAQQQQLQTHQQQQQAEQQYRSSQQFLQQGEEQQVQEVTYAQQSPAAVASTL